MSGTVLPPGLAGSLQSIGRVALSTDTSDASWDDGEWWQQLQPGSWRGVGFVMDAAENKMGRRTVEHTYPYRDTVWIEDLGRLPRRFAFQAYLTGDDVYAQRDAMIKAAEQPGAGTLIHPTLGSLQCVMVDFSSSDRRERGRYVEVTMAFVLSGDLLFPTSGLATGENVAAAAAALQSASTGDFGRMIAALPSVPALAGQGIAGFGAIVTSTMNDAGRSLAAVRGLVGNFGRFASGSRMTTLDPLATVESALSGAVQARSAVLGAVANLAKVANAL